MPTPNNNSNAYQKRVAGNGGYLHDWDEHDTENYPPTRDEYVTRPTSEELAADKSYMNTPWQKPVGDVAYVNNGGVAPENNLPKPKATPMGVGGDGRYANTDAKTGTAALNNLFGDSWALTPEQEQARLRRMHTSSMIGNLGNVMSAFANLYYAGKGAPSQKVPDAVVPDYMSFVDRVNQARRNAEATQLQRDRLMADAEYKNASIAQRMKDAEIRERRLLMDEQKFEWKKQYDQGILDIKSEINRINDMKTRGQIDRWEAQNYTDYLKALTGQQREDRMQKGSVREETDEYGNTKRIVTTPNNGASTQGGTNKGAMPGVQPKQDNKTNRGKMPGVK